MSLQVGRFAPSPTGELHLGNLRTALIAWLSARSQGLGFAVRMEDLDRVTSSPAHEAAQLRALAAIGLDWDGEVIRQSERFDVYERAISTLTGLDRTYECFCTRREIREAAQAPHSAVMPEGAYPGTCRELTARRRSELRGEGRVPALRLRAHDEQFSFVDEICGPVTGHVDDVVLRRNDGVPAYNLAVVVDDAAQDVAEVVRGDDLLSSTPRQIALQRLLDLPTPRYRHVPLVLGGDGVRLAKRHGAVTLTELETLGVTPAAVLSLLAGSLDLAEPEELVSASSLIDRFDLDELPRQPWYLPENLQRSVP
jgi:glutamyl-tRNA synthetase